MEHTEVYTNYTLQQLWFFVPVGLSANRKLSGDRLNWRNIAIALINPASADRADLNKCNGPVTTNSTLMIHFMSRR
jgi:hypothetical protein